MAHTLNRAPYVLSLAALVAALVTPATARACGGFFCGQQPVDQTAERILFEVGPDTVTMTTQISFNGDAADFAWVLPLGEVPLADSLAVFHQQALNALDANSGPVFNLPQDAACYYAGPPSVSGAVDEESSEPRDVTVYIRQEVGEYDVAVIESEDPAALITWLRDEGYRITPAMEPYIERYTEEGLKFLALKLLATADVNDLSPFRFSLPGTAPTIPLRMTALAAEPEMSILAFVFADQRFEGKNWENLTIADDQIRYNPFSNSFPLATNWPRLVAQAVDEAGGQGWVTEYAGSTDAYAELVRSQVQQGNFGTEDDAAAAAELLGVFEAFPYVTRLYTRLSAEEMTSDPVFGRSSLGDVSRDRQLSRVVNDVDQCAENTYESTDPCDFTTCGAGGLCRPVTIAGASNTSSTPLVVAGCACVPGATARPTFGPDGLPTVICQDGRMSFLNAGDRETDGAAVLPDACAGVDCSQHGQCSAVNLTPTCVCDQGYVAVMRTTSDGSRRVECVEPGNAVPVEFYDKRLPSLPLDLPGGREVNVPGVGSSEPGAPGFPLPRENPALSRGDSGGCSVGAPRPAPAPGWFGPLALIGLGAASRLRRRSARD
jgi:MYXO-CTERM domain-containing protein